MNSNIDNNNKYNLNFFRIFVFCIIFIVIALGLNTYSDFVYNNNLNEFYSTFNKYDFDKAINIVDNTRHSNILKRKQLNSDLSSYFTGIVNKVVQSVELGNISDSDAISILSEIKKYNILNNSLDILIASLEANYVYNDSSNSIIDNSENIITDTENQVEDNNLDLGIKAMNDKNYSMAISYFNNISKNSSNDFKKANDYILKCKTNYKNELFIQADELIANKYYTDAIAFLSSYDTSILNSNNSDILNKINSVEMFRDEYLSHIESYPNDDSAYASNAILEAIDIDNVNSFNIESNTSYFVYLNLLDQTTYIYEGSINNWELIKSFPSSTGIPGEETPKGIFSVNGRDEWFFANEFKQGGKYWVRFMGDYLFHSLPFDETQTTIVDDTLGTPASHGCVRLNVEDSKWIYDNIYDGTKVIIN